MTRRWVRRIGLAVAGTAVTVAALAFAFGAGWLGSMSGPDHRFARWASLIAGVVAAAGVIAQFPLAAGGRLLRDAVRRDPAGPQLAALCKAVRRGRLPRVEDLHDPRVLGVHAAREMVQPDRAASSVPAYIPRDVDPHLRGSLVPGGFVLVVGQSTAGKSRAAYEAVRAAFGRRRLVAPFMGALPALVDQDLLPGDCVIWLDDLENHLGTDLTPARLGVLLAAGHAVVATMRHAEVERFRSPARTGVPAGDFAVIEAGRAVLAAATTVTVDRAFSAAELTRARAFDADPRVAEAIANADRYGVAEYLAAGPELLERWRRAWDIGGHPTGAAIVRAAVDCRRAGVTGPVDVALLRALHGIYLASYGGERLRPEPFEEGLAWAQIPVHGTIALLDPSGDGYAPFDYLVDLVQQEQDQVAIPREGWVRLIDLAPVAAMSSIALRTLLDPLLDKDAKFDLTVRAWERGAAETGRSELINNAGVFRLITGDVVAAARWFRIGADKGHPMQMVSLANLARQHGERQSAEHWYRQAGELGHVPAMGGLAGMLCEAGRVEEGERWYRRAAEQDDVEASVGLAELLRGSGRSAEAEDWYRSAAQRGHKVAMVNLGALLFERGERGEARSWWQRAVEAGERRALYNLGVASAHDDDLDQAESWWRQAAEDDQPDAVEALRLLEETRRARAEEQPSTPREPPG